MGCRPGLPLKRGNREIANSGRRVRVSERITGRKAILLGGGKLLPLGRKAGITIFNGTRCSCVGNNANSKGIFYSCMAGVCRKLGIGRGRKGMAIFSNTCSFCHRRVRGRCGGLDCYSVAGRIRLPRRVLDSTGTFASATVVAVSQGSNRRHSEDNGPCSNSFCLDHRRRGVIGAILSGFGGITILVGTNTRVSTS